VPNIEDIQNGKTLNCIIFSTIVSTVRT